MFNISSPLLDSLVLALCLKEDTYGYKITQDIRSVIDISESTLYPILRKLQKDNCLEIYDKETGGRNRRYYRITSKGKIQLDLYLEEWKIYKQKIDELLNGGKKE